MNNKTLGIALVALLAIFGINKLINKPVKRTFDPAVLQVDTSIVDKVSFEMEGAPNYSIFKNNESWKGKSEAVEVPLLQSSVTNFLTSLDGIKMERIVSKDPAKWAQYELDEATTKVVISVFSGASKIKEYHLGKFDFNQQARTAKLYLRLSSGDEVYVINALDNMSLAQPLDAFRDNTVLKIDQESITSVEWELGEQKWGMQKSLTGFVDQSGNALDSTTVANYLATISDFKASGFNDSWKGDFGQFPYAQVEVKTNTGSNPYQIRLVAVEGEKDPFVVQSPGFTASYFSGDSTNTYTRLIKPMSYFSR